MKTILDTVLQDAPGATGGVGFVGETLRDFLYDVEDYDAFVGGLMNVAMINVKLEASGIAPVSGPLTANVGVTALENGSVELTLAEIEKCGETGLAALIRKKDKEGEVVYSNRYASVVL